MKSALSGSAPTPLIPINEWIDFEGENFDFISAEAAELNIPISVLINRLILRDLELNGG